MKVAIIDPWCSDKYEVYTIGFCEGMSRIADVTLISNYYESREPSNFRIKRLFFKRSELMGNTRIRKIVRGIEYVIDYWRVIRFLKSEHFDVVHIQWLLMYKYDGFMLRWLRKYTDKLIYTAHNAIPHKNGEEYVNDLKKIHIWFDRIIVHGKKIKEEFVRYFPESSDKLYIQKHGVHITQDTNYCANQVEKKIIERVNNCNGKIALFAGGMFYNKGVDRLARIWLQESDISNGNLLILAGKKDEQYVELTNLESKIRKCKSILYIPEYVNNNLFSYLISVSDFLVLPYRHASMSGLIYSAAAFAKPICMTDTGALSEYVTSGEDCVVSTNDDQNFERVFREVINMEPSELVSMGKKLKENIETNCNWYFITSKLFNEVYKL